MERNGKDRIKLVTLLTAAAVLAATAEFFNLITGVKLTDQEKADLVAFMLAL